MYKYTYNHGSNMLYTYIHCVYTSSVHLYITLLLLCVDSSTLMSKMLSIRNRRHKPCGCYVTVYHYTLYLYGCYRFSFCVNNEKTMIKKNNNNIIIIIHSRLYLCLFKEQKKKKKRLRDNILIRSFVRIQTVPSKYKLSYYSIFKRYLQIRLKTGLYFSFFFHRQLGSNLKSALRETRAATT